MEVNVKMFLSTFEKIHFGKIYLQSKLLDIGANMWRGLLWVFYMPNLYQYNNIINIDIFKKCHYDINILKG